MALALLFLLMVPVVPYSISFSIPKNYGDKAFSICNSPTLNASQRDNCLQQNAIPPLNIQGRAPIAYRFFGSGPSPYPEVSLVTQGNLSALLYFQGSSIVAAEGPFYFFGPAVLETSGLARINGVSLTP